MKRISWFILMFLIVVGTYVVIIYAEDRDKQTIAKNNINEMSAHKLENTYQNALNQVLKTISIPEGYAFKNVESREQNDHHVWIFRYEKSNKENNGLGGEHYSFTIDKDSYEILGITWMDQNFTSGKQLPSKERTEEIVKSFLNSVQPGLFERLDNHWIRPHDEVISINGRKVTITGMKYKCYLPEDDTWAWVIVAPNEDIITFEQGIKWEKGRVTEKWLHDNWLLENGY